MVLLARANVQLRELIRGIVLTGAMAMMFLVPGVSLQAISSLPRVSPSQSNSPQSRPTITTADIIAMVKAGIGEAVVVAAIEAAPTSDIDRSPQALIELKQAGVSDQLLTIIIKRAGNSRPDTATAAPIAPPSSPAAEIASIDVPNLGVISGSCSHSQQVLFACEVDFPAIPSKTSVTAFTLQYTAASGSSIALRSREAADDLGTVVALDDTHALALPTSKPQRVTFRFQGPVGEILRSSAVYLRITFKQSSKTYSAYVKINTVSEGESQIVAAPQLPRHSVATGSPVKLSGYAEWRRNDHLIIEGQRVFADAATQWSGRARNMAAVPLGDEVVLTGIREVGGGVRAKKIEVKPNGSNAVGEQALFAAAQQLEASWINRRLAADAQQVLGVVESSGPDVDRVRSIVSRLLPAYRARDTIRAYVIRNDDWNAMAQPNGAVWVFSGLLADLSDDELAVILGHELGHVTHEHQRRSSKRNIWTQLGAVVAQAALEEVSSVTTRAALAQVGNLALSAWSNGYSRDLEDQADRVGLRYAFEAGYDVNAAPRLWKRFAEKYGDQGRFTNFFYGDHSTHAARQSNLDREIAMNYRR